MRNAEIALHFDELADLYELDGAIVHRVLAYRNAAKAIREATASVEEVTRLPGFGAKKARKLFDALGVASLDDLREAVEAERLRDVPGFGPKAEENVRAALETGARPQPRVLLSKT